MKEDATVHLLQPVPGAILPLSAVPDPVFSEGMMGSGLAISPTEGKVVSPGDGTVSHIAKTMHAIVITMDGDDSQVLVHVGIDTVGLEGSGFTLVAKQGQHVAAGTLLMRFDLDQLRAMKYDPITSVVLLGEQEKTICFSPLPSG